MKFMLAKFLLVGSFHLPAQVLHYDGFEEKVINPEVWYVKGKLTPNMTMDTGVKRAGKQSVKFFWEPSMYVEGSNASKHSEIAGIHAPLSERESWYDWSVYFPDTEAGASVNQADPEPMITTQWHLRGGKTHPPMTFTAKDGKWQFGYKWGKDHVDEKSVQVDLGTLPYNQWVDLVVHVQWSSNTGAGHESLAEDGLVELWKDGKLLHSKKNVPVGFGDSGGQGWPYFKIGIYHYTGKATGRKVIYFDEVRHTYNGNFGDVSLRKTN